MGPYTGFAQRFKPRRPGVAALRHGRSIAAEAPHSRPDWRSWLTKA